MELQAHVDSISGDTLVDGQPLRIAFPADQPPYIGNTEWYRRHEPITVDGRHFLTQGWQPLVMFATELRYHGHFGGFPVFVEREATGRPELVFMLHSPNCIFQPYPFMR